MTSRIIVLVSLLLSMDFVDASPITCEDSERGCLSANYTKATPDQLKLPPHSPADIRLRHPASPILVDGNVREQNRAPRITPRKLPGIRIHSSTGDLECDNAPSRKLTYCYWAIETGTADMILYSNSHSSALIERNIEPFCEPPESDEGVYGFTFVDKRIAKKYVDAEGSDSLVNNSQRILTNTFYFCCSTTEGCTNYTEVDSNKIIDMLADELLDFAWTYLIKEGDGVQQQRQKPRRDPVECILYGDWITKIPGTRMCILVLDASGTTKVFTGPPIFNHFDMEQQRRELENESFAAAVLRRDFCQPIPPTSGDNVDGDRCHKYLSSTSYILICCCYKAPQRCALRSNDRAYSDARTWAPVLAWQAQIASSWEQSEMNDDYFNWTKMSYLWAKPLILQKSGFIGRIRAATKFVGSLNKYDFDDRISYIHCTEGSFIARGSGAERGTSHILRRYEIARPAGYCVTNLTVTYANNNGLSTIERIAVDVGVGNSNMCYHERTCELTKPRCFNDLIYEYNVTATFTCCCRYKHMCNYRVRVTDKAYALLHSNSKHISWCVNGAVSSILHSFEQGYEGFFLCARMFTVYSTEEMFYFDGITHYSLTPVGTNTIKALVEDPSKNGTCERTIAFPIRDQFCEKRRHEILFPVQFIRCMCATKTSVRCDNDLEEKASDFSENIISSLPTCVGSLIIVNILFDGRTTYEYETQSPMTTDWPICENTVEFFYKRRLFVIRSGPYSIRSTEQDRFTIAWNATSYKCFAKPGRPPCNGKEALLRLVSHYAKYYAAQKSRKKGSLCPGDKTDKPELCMSHTGCFTFYAIDGSLLKRGCMDQIDEIIQRDKSLELLGFCKSRTVLAEIERGPEWKAYYCSGVTHDVNNLQFKEGVLCCCPHKCPKDALNFFPLL